MGPLLLINQSSSASNRRRNSTGSKSTGSSSSGGGSSGNGNANNCKGVLHNNASKDDNKRGDNETGLIEGNGVRINNGLGVTKGLLISQRIVGECSSSSSTEETPATTNQRSSSSNNIISRNDPSSSGVKKITMTMRTNLSNRDEEREFNSKETDAVGSSSSSNINKGLMNSGQFILMNNQTHVRNQHHVSTMQMDKSHLHIATGPSTTTANSNNSNNNATSTLLINNEIKDNNGRPVNNSAPTTSSGVNLNGKKGGGENNHSNNNNGMVNSIRKYLVLLQDCLAIKFIPVYAQNPYSKFNDGT
jgi:hypothetical protein